MNIVFRNPNENDIDEITTFKQEFNECNSGMYGTGVLNECDAEEWLLTNKVMEQITNLLYYIYLQYGLFDNNRLLGLIQIRLELKGYLVEYEGNIGDWLDHPKEEKVMQK